MAPLTDPDPTRQTSGITPTRNLNKLPIPPELLLEIFRLLATRQDLGWLHYPGYLIGTSGTYKKFNEVDPSRHLRTATHVCRSWRNLAINSPTLWSKLIDCSNMRPAWFEVVVHRSRNSPLLATAGRPHVQRDFTSDNFIYLLEQNKEFEELHLDIALHWVMPDADDILLERLRLPMPSLTQFTLHTSSKTIKSQMQIHEGSKAFNIFGGRAPLLRSVTFRGCMPRLKSDLMHSLTHLCLLQHPRGVSWLSLLQHTNSLQDLVLAVDQPNDSTTLTPSYAIHLPHLVHIRIYADHVGAAAELLACIRPAPLRNFVCHFNDVKSEIEDYHLLDTLKGLVPCIPLTNAEYPMGQTSFRWMSGLFVMEISTCGVLFSLYLEGSRVLEHDPGNFDSLMDLCSPLFEPCTHLTLNVTEQWGMADDDDFTKFLRPFVNIRTIKPVGDPVIFPAPRAELPALEHLMMTSEISDFLKYSAYFQPTKLFLRDRIEKGRPIRKISFPDPEYPSPRGIHQNTEAQKKLQEEYNVEIEYREPDEEDYIENSK